MKIVIATPLYPPETADSAVYIKRLAGLLNDEEYSITIVTYASMPERISGVNIVTTDKYRPLIIRLLAYTKILWKAASSADIIYAENGASIELPVFIISLFTKTPIIFHIGDKAAYEYAQKNILLKYIQKLALGRAKKIIEETPLKKPEILPFQEESSEEKEAYATSWSKHLNLLNESFKNV